MSRCHWQRPGDTSDCLYRCFIFDLALTRASKTILWFWAQTLLGKELDVAWVKELDTVVDLARCGSLFRPDWRVMQGPKFARINIVITDLRSQISHLEAANLTSPLCFLLTL
jgi:hypothetical protein